MSARAAQAGPILAIDDEEPVLSGISALLRSNGFADVVCCRDSRLAMDIVRSRDIEAILLDLAMPGMPGQEVLRAVQTDYPQIPVIVVAGSSDVRGAVECMQAGAFDYMVKPVEESRLVSGVRRAIEIRSLRRGYLELRSRLLDSELSRPEVFAPIVTCDRKIRSVFLFIEAVAKTGEPVLITGETGVGKDLFARAVHDASDRQGSFVTVNAAGLDDTMFSDTLFGHRKGAFTGAIESRGGLLESARTGTLFLDEIGDLSSASQVKLLRLLDSGEYYPLGSDLPRRTDARFVLATNRVLEDQMAQDRFRRDLYYRLSTHQVSIPPLRERRDDIALLVDHFTAEAAAALSRPKPEVPRELVTLLQAYPFAGNVRELRAMIYDAMSRHTGRTMSLTAFRQTIGREIRHEPPPGASPILGFSGRLPTIRQATELLVQEALSRARGNQSIAAGLLGISHQALSRRLQRSRGRRR